MPRKPGRPRWEMEHLDKALAHLGGLREVLRRLDSQNLTRGQIVDELERLGGRRVHPQTVTNWLDHYAREVAVQEVA